MCIDIINLVDATVTPAVVSNTIRVAQHPAPGLSVHGIERVSVNGAHDVNEVIILENVKRPHDVLMRGYLHESDLRR